MMNWTIKELREKLHSKEVSAVEVAKGYLKRIQETDEAVNAFVTVVDEEHVVRHAEHAQKEINAGNASTLTGIPYAAKDLFCTKGIRTTASSNILKEYIPPYNATAIHKLGDAVLLGKTNTDEFAQGSSTEYSAFGTTKNPYDISRVAGGSSGGSAAAVAAGQAVFALGSDTGGSVRLPASFCNVVGLKPTYGRISRYGVISMASSLDTVGTLTRSVADAAEVLELLAGPDTYDTTAPDISIDTYTASLEKGINGLRIGVPKEYVELEGIDPEMKAMFESSLQELESAGAEIVEVSLPHTKYGLAAYYVLCPSEVSSNMARFDGMQFGHRSDTASNLDEVFLYTRDEGFGPEVKRRVLVGTFALSSGYYDAYYKKAMQVRRLVKQDFENAFTQVDIIASPVSPDVPFVVGDRDMDPLAMYATDIYTIPTSLAGMPGISVPSAAVKGLPAGLQFIAPQFQESLLLQTAAAFEKTVNNVLELAL